MREHYFKHYFTHVFWMTIRFVFMDGMNTTVFTRLLQTAPQKPLWLDGGERKRREKKRQEMR